MRRNALSAFGHALAVLKNDPELRDDYAAALGSFSNLYRDLGDPSATVKLQEQALHLYEQIGDHAGRVIVLK